MGAIMAIQLVQMVARFISYDSSIIRAANVRQEREAPRSQVHDMERSNDYNDVFFPEAKAIVNTFVPEITNIFIFFHKVT